MMFSAGMAIMNKDLDDEVISNTNINWNMNQRSHIDVSTEVGVARGDDIQIVYYNRLP